MTEFGNAPEGMGFVGGLDPEEWQEYAARQEKLGRLRFDRDELSYRALYGLKAVLSPEQLDRIGPLPEPQEKDSIYSETIISE